MVSLINIVPSMPPRKNAGSDTPFNYIKKNMCLQFLDHLITGIDVHFNKYDIYWFHQLLLRCDHWWHCQYTRAIYQQLIIVKWSLFDGKEDGVFVTFQKDRRQLCKHWNSVIAMHTQIFQSSKKLQLRLENSNILVMFLRCTLRSETIFGSWKLFKNDEKGFLFHVNSSFCSQDMQVFALTFWSCSKTAS